MCVCIYFAFIFIWHIIIYFMGYCVIFQFMYTMCNEQMRVISISITPILIISSRWELSKSALHLGAAAHNCNPSTQGGQVRGYRFSPGVRDQPRQHSETPSLHRSLKITWVWWHMPVVPATQEAEARRSLEPRRSRLQWAMIISLHSSLGDGVRPGLRL